MDKLLKGDWPVLEQFIAANNTPTIIICRSLKQKLLLQQNIARQQNILIIAWESIQHDIQLIAWLNLSIPVALNDLELYDTFLELGIAAEHVTACRSMLEEANHHNDKLTLHLHKQEEFLNILNQFPHMYQCRKLILQALLKWQDGNIIVCYHHELPEILLYNNKANIYLYQHLAFIIHNPPLLKLHQQLFTMMIDVLLYLQIHKEVKYIACDNMALYKYLCILAPQYGVTITQPIYFRDTTAAASLICYQRFYENPTTEHLYQVLRYMLAPSELAALDINTLRGSKSASYNMPDLTLLPHEWWAKYSPTTPPIEMMHFLNKHQERINSNNITTLLGQQVMGIQTGSHQLLKCQDLPYLQGQVVVINDNEELLHRSYDMLSYYQGHMVFSLYDHRCRHLYHSLFQEVHDTTPQLQVNYRPISPPSIQSHMPLKRLSASAIEMWMHNPWVFYLRYIGKIKPLPPYTKPIAQEFGIAMHHALEKITKQQLPWEKLTECFPEQPWHTISKRIATWLTAQPLLREACSSEVLLNKTFGAFIIEARVDLVIHTATAKIYLDFKTGHPPSATEINCGYKPQLAIYQLLGEGIVGFIHLKGREPVGQVLYPKINMLAAQQGIDNIVTHLQSHLVSFTSTENNHIEYSHAIRLEEWS